MSTATNAILRESAIETRKYSRSAESIDVIDLPEIEIDHKAVTFLVEVNKTNYWIYFRTASGAMTTLDNDESLIADGFKFAGKRGGYWLRNDGRYNEETPSKLAQSLISAGQDDNPPTTPAQTASKSAPKSDPICPDCGQLVNKRLSEDTVFGGVHDGGRLICGDCAARQDIRKQIKNGNTITDGDGLYYLYYGLKRAEVIALVEDVKREMTASEIVCPDCERVWFADSKPILPAGDCNSCQAARAKMLARYPELLNTVLMLPEKASPRRSRKQAAYERLTLCEQAKRRPYRRPVYLMPETTSKNYCQDCGTPIDPNSKLGYCSPCWAPRDAANLETEARVRADQPDPYKPGLSSDVPALKVARKAEAASGQAMASVFGSIGFEIPARAKKQTAMQLHERPVFGKVARVNPKAPEPPSKLTLTVQDTRTEDQKESDRMSQAEKDTIPMFPDGQPAIARSRNFTGRPSESDVTIVEAGETFSKVKYWGKGEPALINNNNLRPGAPAEPAELQHHAKYCHCGNPDGGERCAGGCDALVCEECGYSVDERKPEIRYCRSCWVNYQAEHKTAPRPDEDYTASVTLAKGGIAVELDRPALRDFASTMIDAGFSQMSHRLFNFQLTGPTPKRKSAKARTLPACAEARERSISLRETTEAKDGTRNNTRDMVSTLAENKQDFEWYPTTGAMIQAVAQCVPVDARSILDIGAGDGRVLKGLSEKCVHAMLYSIELSQILVQAQPANVIPIGTNLFEQNLACLPVDFIFCNPPYSEYEDWTCKIIAEGYAQRSFLVIPNRWKDSKRIADSLRQRGATARVIHSDDFHNAERQARAVVDVVKVTYPKADYRHDQVKDPFDIWFDQNIDTFDHAEEFEESETGSELKKQYSHSSIDDMVAAYREDYELLEGNYRAIFKLDYAILKELGIDKNHVRDGLKKKMSDLKIKYWRILFDRLDAITSRLSTKSREALLQKLTDNTAVEFTASNAYAVVLWAIKNARQYFDDQLVELFKALATFDNALKYKSNVKTWGKDEWRYSYGERPAPTHYSLDYRIVVEKYGAIYKGDGFGRCEYPGNLEVRCHNLLADVVAVMSNLGFSTGSLKSLDRAWEGGKWQDWYGDDDEILFQCKAYMNGNLHFRFKPEAIKALNIEAGRLLKWVRSAEEVVQEMGYTAEEAEQYFNSNAGMLSNTVKLLGEIANGSKSA